MAELAISGHWRLKRGDPVVLDWRGTLRFASEVHRCACCTLHYDTYEMARRGNNKRVYCKKCHNDYHAWRRARVGAQRATGVAHDLSRDAFRRKYLMGELTMSPPVQLVNEDAPPPWSPD